MLPPERRTLFSDPFDASFYLTVPARNSERERSERSREGEDDVEVVDVEDASHALLDPTGLREALALRTVPIATRVVRWAFEAAPRAHVEVAAQGWRPADGNRP